MDLAGIIPPLGGTLDFSPILAFVTLNFFTSSAAALPCEVDANGNPIVLPKPQTGVQQMGNFAMALTEPQRKWAMRMLEAHKRNAAGQA